ncbi:glycogen operon protein [Izhakiella capsodis]|uniref:Glycogen operon protein n=1 Tax=Izhakiella capsodis TaxID=1367852 RepID=A0A1I4UUU9_9GAMM|nr:glycogen debranching protein GlgX [Izhakiella capsodis]SFM92774.1 glycogen operon protein [Izhakiella capsodis]
MSERKTYRILAGSSYPLGANYDGEGVNFALFSAYAERVELCLYAPDGKTEIDRLELPEYTHEIWHGYVPGLQAGALYGFRVYGPFEPQAGHRFNPNKLLIDPYARELVGNIDWNEAHFAYDLLHDDRDLTFDSRDSAPFTAKCRVIDSHESITRDASRPAIPWPHTVIYEAHVKGFTQCNPALPAELRGTYDGMGHNASVEYIKSLGVTSVELLPVHWFPDDQHLLDRGRVNYWGYNTLGFFAPASRYYGPRGLTGVRDMVRAFHDAGIEVILDVVYNHTAEGNELGPTLSFRGIDNFSYYRTLPDQPRYYINDTGTGNTVNTSHPRVLQLVTDSLRYWADTMEIDGFRFDLGTILGREPEGFDQRGGFFDAITQDPTLAQLKLIGEPWDIGPGGYQVGGFPPGWAEWNDKYRDTVREYWKGDNVSRDFAARLLGSGDIYDLRGRRPWASVNFITAHDGFTLNDLVSYNDKHNEDNGEDNNDGHNDNRSANYGWEGPTDDNEINSVRERQKRNFLTTLFFSHGTPMLLAGDETGRSQRGNNNGYCQDNALSWIQWENLSDGAEALRAFTQHIIRLRAQQPLLRRDNWRDGMEIKWFNAGGGFQLPEQWEEGTTLGVYIGRADDSVGEELWQEILMLLNPYQASVDFRIPQFGEDGWILELSTADTAQHGQVVSREIDYALPGGSITLFRRP